MSTHEYPTDITPTVRNTMRQVMEKARQQVGNRPLFYTEYNDGLYFNPAYHDTPYASAFIIFNVIGNLPKCYIANHPCRCLRIGRLDVMVDLHRHL